MYNDFVWSTTMRTVYVAGIKSLLSPLQLDCYLSKTPFLVTGKLRQWVSNTCNSPTVWALASIQDKIVSRFKWFNAHILKQLLSQF